MESTTFEFQRRTKIDRDTYNKQRAYPAVTQLVRNAQGTIVRKLCRGYEQRHLPIKVDRICVHTTNGNLGTDSKDEWAFLLNSPDVSCFYGVGKDGSIVRFLQPAAAVAWTQGTCIVGWNNYNTVGIECHFTPGESWTSEMRVSLTNLILELAYEYTINVSEAWRVETHRRIAIPTGRKVDPSGWPDDEFYEWRDWLCTVLWPNYQRFRRSLAGQV